MPVLKWKMSEYQALFRLKKEVKDKVVPLIVIPPIEYDFEEKRLKKDIDDHLEKFAERVKAKWGRRLLLVDMHESIVEEKMANGDWAIKYILDTLNAKNCIYTPVINLHRGKHFTEALQHNIENSEGLAIRLTLSDLASPGLNNSLLEIISTLSTNLENIDLVIDLESPESFLPYDGFSNVISHYAKGIVSIDKWRSLTIVGTSLDMSKVKRPGGEFDRHEWLLYKELLDSPLSEARRPTFGDYTIETPQFPSLDFRYMNPGGKIIYSFNDSWLVIKNGSFRDNPAQMHDHCNQIVGSGHFSGSGFSWGDEKIAEVSSGNSKNFGQLGTWKQVGMSHHIRLVTEQISNLFSS